VRCESAVRAVTSENLLPAACRSPSAMRCLTDTPPTGSAAAVFPRRSPIQVLTAVDDATPPLGEGSGVGDYLYSCMRAASLCYNFRGKLDSNPQPLDYESVTLTTRPRHAVGRTLMQLSERRKYSRKRMMLIPISVSISDAKYAAALLVEQ
jgi:hypothetical protein